MRSRGVGISVHFSFLFEGGDVVFARFKNRVDKLCRVGTAKMYGCAPPEHGHFRCVAVIIFKHAISCTEAGYNICVFNILPVVGRGLDIIKTAENM